VPVVRVIVMFAAVIVMTAALARAAGPSLLFDPATGEVMSHERAGEPWYPASLTKLMTAYLVFGKLRSGELRLDQKIPVSVFANSQVPSKIGIRPGGTVTVDFALQSLLVYSANDMAVVLAEATSGTVHNFARQMNETAARLGMTGTHYVNPNGLFEPRQVTTARDIAVLAATLLHTYPERAHYFAQPFVAAGKRKLMNRNSLIRLMPESDGMKTGFVCNSGFNLVASATREGRKLVAIVFGAQSSKARADLAQMLLTDGFARVGAGGRPKLSEIANLPLGTLVPADMTASVCRQKTPVAVLNAKELTGWGISFGQYDTAQKADMALRGRLLGEAGLAAAGQPAVIRMPGKNSFSAVLWNLDQVSGLAICAQYRSEQAPCDVMTPEAFAQIAALTVQPEAKPRPPQAQGSDGGRPAKKKKKAKK
jgi:D-alanyl-D-alanine carboxypeptidase